MNITGIYNIPPDPEEVCPQTSDSFGPEEEREQPTWLVARPGLKVSRRTNPT